MRTIVISPHGETYGELMHSKLYKIKGGGLFQAAKHDIVVGCGSCNLVQHPALDHASEAGGYHEHTYPFQST